MGHCWPKPIDSIYSTNSFRVRGSGKKPRADSPSAENGGGGDEAVPASGECTTQNLKMFTLAELSSATRNFRPDSVLGEGGFGRVFRGFVDRETYAPSRVGIGMPVAVKKSNPDSEQGLKEWQAEVDFLGKFSHPNLVKLLGYCWEDNQFLLVYEYMQKGSLESHLFRKGGAELPWETRMKIALGAARGLAFLHATKKQVIFRDFKASNILLDGEFNPKLSDFGLAKLGPMDGDTHVTTKPVGTYGYAAPEYIATGHLYVKSDVYGFGVVLLELITGLRVLDPNRPSSQTNLVEWAIPYLCNKKKWKSLIDQRLMGRYPSKVAREIVELILNCLAGEPKGRPSMEEVLSVLERTNDIQLKPKESKAKSMHDTSQLIRDRCNYRSHKGPVGDRGNNVGPRKHKNKSPIRSY